jgi:hypothetical protein
MTGAAMAGARRNNGMQPTPQRGAADAGRYARCEGPSGIS